MNLYKLPTSETVEKYVDLDKLYKIVFSHNENRMFLYFGNGESEVIYSAPSTFNRDKEEILSKIQKE